MTTTAIVHIGNPPDTIKAAAAAIVAVLSAAPTEAAQVAAVNCLSALAHAPSNTSITGCNFQVHAPAAKKRRRR